MRSALTTVLVLALAASPLMAHGGQYKGPADAGTGLGSSGGSVAPPTNPGGATAPGPGAPAAGPAGAGGAGAVTAARGTGRGASNRRAANTGVAMEVTKGFEIWEFWWENNKDRFLNLKERLVRQTSVSGSPGALTGRGKRIKANTSRRPSRAMIDQEVIPALLNLLKTSDNRDILDSAVLACGRTAEEGMWNQIVEAATPLLSHPERSVRTSATLTLGVLGSPDSTQMLEDILQDNSAGRRLTGGAAVDWLQRSFAALSLGLIGSDDCVDALMDVIQRLPDTDKDIKVCSIVGLGLLPHDHPKADRVEEFLVGLMDDTKLDALIRSYVPTSLGKLGRPEAVPALLKTFEDRDVDNLVLQSCAIGLGQLASVPENHKVEGAIKTLLNYIQEGRDQQARNFSIIALAEIGARDENPMDENGELTPVHQEIIDQLGKEIQGKGKSKDNRSWGALAAAIYSRAQEHAQPIFIDRIKAAYEKESDPSYKSAFAVALGLLNDQTSAEMIFDDFKTRNENDFRGYASVALGFMNYTDAANAMRGIVQSKGTTPTLRLQVATGLGLMSDTQAVPVLIDTLNSATTLGVSSAVAKALGLIGDRDAIAPLKEIAADESVQKITRAFACVALGIVGEKTDLPWNAVISADNNYRAKVPSIEEVLDIL